MTNRSQQTLGGTGFEKYTKITRRAQFLAEMDRVVPWRELCARIEPVYPKPGHGRPPIGVERMLRMYFLQHWFNLSDPAVEEALYDSPVMRAFVGIDLGREPVPDETTVCKFRHLLEQHGLGRGVFDTVNAYLRERGITVNTGTIVDATIINAPSSTKNATGTRDPEMHQTKKGQQWYFGMKGHFGVDSQSKLIHSVEATSANTHDGHVLPWLLHGHERRVWGDSAYAGHTALLTVCAPQARDFTQRRARTPQEGATNRWKSRIRARVEHPIGIIKRVFRFTKVCYRGLAKNRHRLEVACALANLFMMRKRLLRLQEA
jgi:IS5 family transposase